MKSFEGWGLKVNNEKNPFFQIELFKDKLSVNLADVGQGMGQVLPIYVRAFKEDNTDTLIIIEQPELHLHPAAHGAIAETIAQSCIKDSKKQFLIETHSENFILRLRRLIVEGTLNHEMVGIYYVHFNSKDNKSSLMEITINELGEVSDWPADVFSEALGETIAIRTAQYNKEEDAN